MADLITRLLLNTREFDSSLSSSTREIQQFQQHIQTFSRGAIDAFTRFAGAIGLAVGAGELLNKMMESNQTTSDLFHNNVNAAKDSVDLFFKSLTTGDWSAFNNGLLGAFDNAFKLSTMLDELADKKLSLNYIKAEDLKDIEKFETIAKDTNKTLEERINAFHMMQGSVNNLSKKTNNVKQSQMDLLNKQYSDQSGLKINEDDIKYFASNTNFDGALTSEANNIYKEYIALMQQVKGLGEAKAFDLTGVGNTEKAYNEKKKELELFKSSNEFLIKQGFLTEENDENRKKTIDTLIEQLNLEREVYSLQKRSDETGRAVRGGVTTTSKKGTSSPKTKEVIYEVGSLGNINKELSSLNNQLLQATEESTRFGIRTAIEKLNREKLNIDLEATLSVNQLPNNKSINKPIGKKPTDALNDKIPTFNTDPIELINTDNDTLEYLSAINGLMVGMGSLTDNAAASWINYAANIIAGVASMLPALASLFGITAALGMAEQAKLPFPLSVIALAATGAALVASIAMIPKFANGGIVSGNSFAGDNVIARVNSGEMILNNKQQANLFSLLDGGASSNNNNGGGNGILTFKINGKDLYATLNNYSSSIKKY